MSRKRLDLSTLTDAVGENSPVDPTATVDGIWRPNLPLTKLAPNPRNRAVGDLSDLQSIVEKQLQPVTAISRARWLTHFPEDSAVIGSAEFVIIAGCRRLAAAHEFGREGLDTVIRDSLARDRPTLLWASIMENLERRNLDVIEEATAVEQLVSETGSASAAAKLLNRTNGWVSQRRALLELTPELREKVRAGELAIREARSLARVPAAEQVTAWLNSEAAKREPGEQKRPTGHNNSQHTTQAVSRALRRLKVQPANLAAAVAEAWDAVEIDRLIEELQSVRSP